MRLLKGYLPCLFLWSALLAVLLLSCGCRTTPQNLFAVSGPGWRVQQGQALWRPANGLPQFGGDLVFAGDTNGCSFVEFDKTPLTLVAAEITPARWQVRFPQQQSFYAGNTPGPTRLIWLYLPAALAGKSLPSPLHFENKPDGGWRLENFQTGETLDGFLSP